MSENCDKNISTPNFWNKLYLNKKDKWSLNAPTPAFMNWGKKHLKDNNYSSNIKICIPGCGKGDDVLFFASCGYQVYAFDFSSYATNHLINKSKDLNLNINIINENFFDIEKNYMNFFDIIIEYTFFCAIKPSDRINYINICNNILKDNGKIVAIFLPLKDVPENNPPYTVSLNKTLKQFSNSFKYISKYYPTNSINKRKGNEIFIEFIKK